MELAEFGGFFGRLPVLSRDNVGGVPPRPMVLRGGWFVLAMMLLRLTQKLCQRRDVQIAESASGRRVVISWNSQVLPSGSLNVAKEK